MADRDLIAELRTLSKAARSATLELGWPFDGAGVSAWAGCVEGLLGGPVGKYCAALDPDRVDALLDELEDLRGDRNARLLINLQAAEYRVQQLEMAYGQQDLALDASRQHIADLDRQYQNALTEIGDKGARIVALKAAIAEKPEEPEVSG